MLSYRFLKDLKELLPTLFPLSLHQARQLLSGAVLLSVCLFSHTTYAMDDIDSARRALRQIYYQLNQQQPTTTIYCGCDIKYQVVSKDKKFRNAPKNKNATATKATPNTPALHDSQTSPDSLASHNSPAVHDTSAPKANKDYPPPKFGKNDRVRWSFDSSTCGFTPRPDRLNRPHRPHRHNRSERLELPEHSERLERPNRPNYDHAHRVELAHLMPASEFGHNLACWKAGGRKQCREDKTFSKMEGDLHNLYPSIGAIKRDRLNFPFADWKGTPDQYGKCQMLIDAKDKRAQPPKEARGPIARAYLYMAETYKLTLTAEQRKLYTDWHEQYPATALECERNKLIAQKQGNENHFISDSCKLNPPKPVATTSKQPAAPTTKTDAPVQQQDAPVPQPDDATKQASAPTQQ